MVKNVSRKESSGEKNDDDVKDNERKWGKKGTERWWGLQNGTVMQGDER